MARAGTVCLVLWLLAVVTDGKQEVSNSTEAEHITAAPTPPIPLRPEYAHPAGAEALDPYNSENNHPAPNHRDYLEEDYDHESHKEDDHDSRDDADELPSLSGDHLLQSSTDDLPIFLLEPQHAFVVRNKPAMLRCRAANALQVYFKCNDVRSVASTQFEFVDPQSGVRIVEAECNVTRDQVEEYFSEEFSCTCFAWSSRGDIRSQPAIVKLACNPINFESIIDHLNMAIFDLFSYETSIIVCKFEGVTTKDELLQYATRQNRLLRLD
ncbi:Netrin receptor unc-5 [Papilio machaon]|uniref:Netrin receptor unc-5 n=1 Tax=Papilio machaon TaxID=76193 RepID=A0A194RG58_PAPMA|nr:Netrin receptor unc-5 [Papilio machaon]